MKKQGIKKGVVNLFDLRHPIFVLFSFPRENDLHSEHIAFLEIIYHSAVVFYDLFHDLMTVAVG